MTGQPDIFVIGTASLDVLHLANGQTVHTAGGAGLYTALAAHKAGGHVGLYAPRSTPLPPSLQPAADRLLWLGPEVAPDMLPRLEIQHQGGGKATLLDASWGAEPQLLPQAMPRSLARASIVHIAALSSAQRQLAFANVLKSHGMKISVGTYARLVYHDTHRVSQLFEQVDIFFMNQNEANGLLGNIARAHTRSGALLFITLDAEGALVIEGEQVTPVAGHPVPEVDPTGAGDTFCGAVLAGLVRGLNPVGAAQAAVKLAAQTVSAVGPTALLDI